LITHALLNPRGRRHLTRAHASSRGQSLVEFALLLPLLLLIVLFAVDFGRIYMGWVTINGMARVGANYAAQHPDAWTTPGDPTAQAEYLTLMTRSQGAMDCDLVPPPNPTFPSGRTVGKPAQADIDCDFHVLAPLISLLVGDPVRVSASSSFPITYGCLAGCPPPPATGPPPPPVSNCRVIPDMVGKSVEGAEDAWIQAGFLEENVTKPVGALPTDTVATATVSPPPDGAECPTGEAFFSASVEFGLETAEPSNPPTCLTLPNVLGMTVEAARNAWDATDFTGTFTPPTGVDPHIVVAQTATPTADPGDCAVPETSLSVAYVPPSAPPPPPPCKVPSLVNTSTSSAMGTWTGAGFTGANLTFKQNPPPDYDIKAQTLVGGTWVSCESSMEVRK
jgi:TadE-like protein